MNTSVLSTSAITRLFGSGTSGYVLTSNGAGSAPSWQVAVGGGIADGDKGDITVSGSGAVWTLDLRLNQILAPTGSVDFNGQQATNFRIENRTSDPASPTVGQCVRRRDYVLGGAVSCC